MSDRLNLAELVNQISHEYFLFGNCVTFTEDTDPVKNKKKNCFDRDTTYQGWKKILILPPDQVRVRRIPLSDEVLLDYIPDPKTLCFLKKERKLLSTLNSENQVPLDQDPATGSFAHFFARKMSQYDTIGISIVEKHVNELSENKKVELKIFEAEKSLLSSKIKKFVEVIRALSVFEAEHRNIRGWGLFDETAILPTPEVVEVLAWLEELSKLESSFDVHSNPVPSEPSLDKFYAHYPIP